LFTTTIHELSARLRRMKMPARRPNSSPPNALIGGPVRSSPGFPLKACGNDGSGTATLQPGPFFSKETRRARRFRNKILYFVFFVSFAVSRTLPILRHLRLSSSILQRPKPPTARPCASTPLKTSGESPAAPRRTESSRATSYGSDPGCISGCARASRNDAARRDQC
jgi:hypothetical protein